MIHDLLSTLVEPLGLQSKRILNNDTVPAIDVAGIIESIEEKIMTQLKHATELMTTVLAIATL